MASIRPSSVRGLPMALTLALCCGTASAQSLTWIGTLGGNASRAHAISDDGSVLTGFAVSSSGHTIPVNWSNGAFTDLGDLGIEHGWSLGLSGDGAVAVGFSGSSGFRWSSGAMTPFGTTDGQASGASYDGSVLCGWINTTTSPIYGRAFIWTSASGIQDIGTLGGTRSWAKKVSDDGSIAVGRAHDAAGNQRAFRWTAAGGMQALGGAGSDANNISPEGSAIVGWNNGFACKWTSSGGFQDLSGTLGFSAANAASTNGDLIVGWRLGSTTREAIMWSALGAQNMNTVFASQLSPGSMLWDASDVSPDGRYIVGYGWNAVTGREEGYIIDTVPTPSSLVALGGASVLVRPRRRASLARSREQLYGTVTR